MKAEAKATLAKVGRVWSGPGRWMRLTGPESARIYLGLYEIELNHWIRRLAGPGVETFDIGAQYGFDAIMFARLTHSRVLTVEADKELEDLIRENIGRNGLTRLVQPHFGWVGDGTDGTVTIDQLSSDHFVPSFVKLDIEGAEGAALRGATETLSKCDSWLIETHSLAVENECLGILTDHGFRIEIQNQRRWLPDHRPTEHNRWVVAIRE
jgi:hypothetical protein